MVIADLFIVDDLLCMDRNSAPEAKRRRGVHDQAGQARRHVLSKIPAVGAGVGDELFLVERLGVVEGLLRRKAQQPVGVPLERGQVVEGRWALGFFLAFSLLHNSLAEFSALC